MEKKFIVPVSSMLIGLAVWIIFLVVVGSNKPALWAELLFGVLVGGIILFSAFSCRKAGGAPVANLFRAILLFVMAVITYWLIGIGMAVVLIVASISTGTLVLKAKKSETGAGSEPNS